MTDIDLKNKYGETKVWVIKDDKIREAFKHQFSGIETVVNLGFNIVPLRTYIRQNMEPMLRYKAETNNKYRQIITYVVVTDSESGDIFCTQRIGGDHRLVGMYSIGIGGHVEPPEDVYEAMYRELNEEIGLTAEDIKLCPFKGYIYDSSEPVSKVHVGFVFLAQVKGKRAHVLEKDKLVGEWLSKDKLTKLYEAGRLEGWSNIVYERMVHDGYVVPDKIAK